MSSVLLVLIYFPYAEFQLKVQIVRIKKPCRERQGLMLVKLYVELIQLYLAKLNRMSANLPSFSSFTSP